jgi:hypothetical protein
VPSPRVQKRDGDRSDGRTAKASPSRGKPTGMDVAWLIAKGWVTETRPHVVTVEGDRELSHLRTLEAVRARTSGRKK